MNEDGCILLAERWSIFCSRFILIKYPLYVVGIMLVMYQSIICMYSVDCISVNHW